MPDPAPDNSVFDWIPPMKAAVGLPADQTGWVTELKWDGIRTQISTDGHSTVVRSSSGRDISSHFPELADFGPSLGATATFDGEIVVFEGERPVFQRVLQRLNVDRVSAALVEANPAVFIAFDLLRLDDKPLLDLPYHQRRRLLVSLLDDATAWKVSPSTEGEADAVMAFARGRELEGVVLKRKESVYRPGSRSNDWRKVKIRLRQEFVVGGWLAGQGALKDEIGSLVVGVWDGPNLVVTGTAGSGLTDAERARLADLMIERPDPPFTTVPPLDKKPTWVEPTIVVEVEYGDWPSDGMLRHPVYIGRHPDRDPADVRREVPPPGTNAVR